MPFLCKHPQIIQRSDLSPPRAYVNIVFLSADVVNHIAKCAAKLEELYVGTTNADDNK